MQICFTEPNKMGTKEYRAFGCKKLQYLGSVCYWYNGLNSIGNDIFPGLLIVKDFLKGIYNT